MKKKTAMILIWAVFLLGICGGMAYQPAVTAPGQHAQKLDKQVKVTMDYYLYLPQDYGKAGKKWPLILFLHGAGERGDKLELVKKHGPPKLTAQGKAMEFIVVSPQCPRGEMVVHQCGSADCATGRCDGPVPG